MVHTWSPGFLLLTGFGPLQPGCHFLAFPAHMPATLLKLMLPGCFHRLVAFLPDPMSWIIFHRICSFLADPSLPAFWSEFTDPPSKCSLLLHLMTECMSSGPAYTVCHRYLFPSSIQPGRFRSWLDAQIQLVPGCILFLKKFLSAVLIIKASWRNNHIYGFATSSYKIHFFLGHCI